MQDTPQSQRLTVSIFGSCNAGKSALFNAITDTDNAIVSEFPGTTTDPVAKSMELLPHGPIVLIDTAGISDKSALGDARERKTRAVLERTDLALYAMDPAQPDLEDYRAFLKELEKRKIPHLALATKHDRAEAAAVGELLRQVPGALKVSVRLPGEVERLKETLAALLDDLKEEEHGLVGGLLAPGSVAVLVAPVDSEAPKGRLILPQVQLIRDCLDHGIRCHVTTEYGLQEALRELAKVDLVVTDSQAFHGVAELTPESIPLTSFSILMARQKSDLAVLEEGAKALGQLQEGDRVLIAETCTHNRSHEDIGRVKIPRLLQQKAGCSLQFDFCAGRDYPEGIGEYRLVVHCGGCMITRREMASRVRTARQAQVPITNYGIVLAWCNGILERCMEIMHKEDGGRVS